MQVAWCRGCLHAAAAACRCGARSACVRAADDDAACRPSVPHLHTHRARGRPGPRVQLHQAHEGRPDVHAPKKNNSTMRCGARFPGPCPWTRRAFVLRPPRRASCGSCLCRPGNISVHLSDRRSATSLSALRPRVSHEKNAPNESMPSQSLGVIASSPWGPRCPIRGQSVHASCTPTCRPPARARTKRGPRAVDGERYSSEPAWVARRRPGFSSRAGRWVAQGGGLSVGPDASVVSSWVEWRRARAAVAPRLRPGGPVLFFMHLYTRPPPRGILPRRAFGGDGPCV